MSEKERERLFSITEIERSYWERGILPAGMDEVGRGPLAGPVVAGCIILPPEPLIEFVKDSKKLSEKRRESLYPLLKENALAFSTGWVYEAEIDRINILEATKKAFLLAFSGMDKKPGHVLVDAMKDLPIEAEQHPFIHGDALSYLIGAASILAKVERDHYMSEMDSLYPQYGFSRNKGYGTAEHIRALKEFGPCPIHRRSFIKNFVGE